MNKQVCSLFRIAMLLGALAATRPARAESCYLINAKGVGQDDGQGKTTGKTIGGGLLQGTVEGVLTPTPPSEGDTVIMFKEVVTFTSEQGSLTVEVQGAIDVTTGKFNASGPVKDAKGKLAGATGQVALTGIADLTNGLFTEDVSGVVCVASAP